METVEFDLRVMRVRRGGEGKKNETDPAEQSSDRRDELE